MPHSSNEPHYALAAIKRIYDGLPELLGDAWPSLQPQVDEKIKALEATSGNYVAMTELSMLLWPHEAANQRLTDEISIQKAISQNIADQMSGIAEGLGIDPNVVDGLSAAAYSRITWEVDAKTIPPPEDTSKRSITMGEGGVDGGQSVKFKNMQLDLGDFSQIAAGFVTTGFDIMDMPHPLLIAAGILLTVNALHDAMKVELSEQEASVFWGMIKAGERDLTEEAIQATMNAERKQYGLPALNEAQVRHSLAKLKKMKSIAQADGVYTIIEQYRVKN